METLNLVVHLDPRTKKNHQTIAGRGPRCPVCRKPFTLFVRQGPAYDEYASAAKGILQRYRIPQINTPVNIEYRFYMKTHRKVDALNLAAAMDDILVAAGILQDDNSSIVMGHDGMRVYYDKENPRTEITITPFEEDV